MINDEIQNLKSSVLIIGSPPPKIRDLGVDVISDLVTADRLLHEDSYSVVIISLKFLNLQTLDGFLKKVSQKNNKIILVLEGTLENIEKIITSFSLYAILHTFDDDKIEDIIKSSIRDYNLEKQEDELFSLLKEDNVYLLKTLESLKEKIEKKGKNLLKAKEKLNLSSERVESLHKSLVLIHQSKTIEQIEIELNQILKQSLGLNWLKIVLLNSNEPIDFENKFTLSTPLIIGEKTIGQIYFSRDLHFTSEEDHFLLQLTEAVSLAVDRILKLLQIDNLKKQWTATFDSITKPVCLINQDMMIMQANQSYLAKAEVSHFSELKDKKCYEVLFQTHSACKGCDLGKKFQIYPKNEFIIEVFSHTMQEVGEKIYVNLYNDVTHEKKWERELLTSNKMAELGIVGSSIAHELNNPLGGMLAFFQLIKADIPKSDPIYPDIIELENGALRCKNIVEDLLGFSRISTEEEIKIININEVIEKSKRIVELQSRPRGIKIVLNVKGDIKLIKARMNPLSQAFCNILYQACEEISKVKESNKEILITSSMRDIRYIEIELSYEAHHFQDFPEKNSLIDIGFLLAEEIFRREGGILKSRIVGQKKEITITFFS